MDQYIHRQNLALLRKRLAETQDEKQRAIVWSYWQRKRRRARLCDGMRGVEYGHFTFVSITAALFGFGSADEGEALLLFRKRRRFDFFAAWLEVL